MTTVAGIESNHPMTAGIPWRNPHIMRTSDWTHHCAYHDGSNGQRSTKADKYHQSWKQDAADPDVVPERQRPIAVPRGSVSGAIAIVQHVIARSHYPYTFCQAQLVFSVLLLSCTSNNIH